MTAKFDNFVAALEQLCVEHDVYLEAFDNGGLGIRDKVDIRGAFYTDLLYDYTKEQ